MGESAESYYHGGFMKAAFGEYEDAIADFDKAIKLKSHGIVSYLVLSYLARGEAKAKLGKHKKAIADFDKAIKLDPYLAPAYHKRGIVKAELGKYKKAIADFEKARDLFAEMGESDWMKEAENEIKKTESYDSK